MIKLHYILCLAFTAWGGGGGAKAYPIALPMTTLLLGVNPSNYSVIAVGVGSNELI